MMQLLFADLRRMSKHSVRMIVMILTVTIFSMIPCFLAEEIGGGGPVGYITVVRYILPYMAPVIGILEFGFVFLADLKARSMHQAIGHGVSRAGIVLAKYMELALMTLADMVLCGAFIVGMAVISGWALNMGQLNEVAAGLFTQWLRLITCGSIAVIPVYLFRNIITGILLYLLLLVDVVMRAMDGFLANTPVRQFFLTRVVERLNTGLVAGRVDVRSMMILLGYIVIGCTVTILLYRKKELDF